MVIIDEIREQLQDLGENVEVTEEEGVYVVRMKVDEYIFDTKDAEPLDYSERFVPEKHLKSKLMHFAYPLRITGIQTRFASIYDPLEKQTLERQLSSFDLDERLAKLFLARVALKTEEQRIEYEGDSLLNPDLENLTDIVTSPLIALKFRRHVDSSNPVDTIVSSYKEALSYFD